MAETTHTEERQGRMRFRPALGATIFTVVAIAIMLGLGTWQLQRLAWKTELIERIEAGLNAAPVPLPTVIGNPAEWDYHRVSATGRFLHDHELDLAARSLNGRIGYHVVTPLQRDDGTVVLVNRGWIPTEARDPATRPDGLLSGTVTVEGIVRVPTGPGWMQPDNDAWANVWFWYDIPAMAASAGVTGALPVIVEAAATPNPGGLPVGGQSNVVIPNNHLQYVVTWYGLALTLLVVYIVSQRRRDSDPT
ncbi:hypothetical protein N825_13020 [Skermanella stibiiresistens SB22]|uniref:SURF1-like protein n=1 Tax=Skermanella stibiiresistens SB22 TaxID=1385369 RepID=W9H126_9PROT|nr:SURF1 family protein [Skermanella stibiiresistens]EWY38412.1 hypothetical protein N825_13020 [Skermanella stibiiresistens SB22]